MRIKEFYEVIYKSNVCLRKLESTLKKFTVKLKMFTEIVNSQLVQCYPI